MREKHIFTSNGHLLDIQIIPSKEFIADATTGAFLLRYEGKETKTYIVLFVCMPGFTFMINSLWVFI